jgi:Protein of unknown function (DUF3108)
VKRVLVVLLWSLGFPVSAVDLSGRIDMLYSVRSGAIEGEVVEALEIRNENGARSYVISSEARAVGLSALVKPGSIVRGSGGIITRQGLQPGRFSDRRSEKDPPSVAIFDWRKRLLTLQHKGNEEQKILPPGTLDRLTTAYSFALTAAPADKMINVHETDGHTLTLLRYIVGKEILDTPMGRIQTIVLTMQQGKDDKRARKIWLSPAHHMLPVRIVAVEPDGLELDQMIMKISYANDLQ